MAVEISLAKNSVLIVDNNVEDLEFLSKVLSSEYIVYKENDKKNAAETALSNLPDLILLSGHDVIPTLKKSSETEGIPIIILIEADSFEDEEGEFLHGAVDYIQKPLPPVVVKSRVRNHIHLVNQKRILDKLDNIDLKTGMYSSKFFMERLDQEWRRAIRDKTQLSILLLGINDFCAFKEEQKDEILKEISCVIKNNIKRAMDIIARCEDEMFAILLPNTPSYGAAIVAELIRKNIEKTPPAGITASIVASSATPTMNSASADFFSIAMETLDKLDESGKNMVHTVPV